MATAQTYRSKMFKLGLLAVGATTFAGFINGRIIRIGAPGENFWLVFPALLLVFALAMAAVQPFWNRLDDVQKNGHLVSWYWGGQAGAVVVLMGLVAATGTHSHYSLGGLAVFMGQAVAFGIAWLIWRLRLRGPVE